MGGNDDVASYSWDKITLSSRIVLEGKGEPDATPTFTRVMDIERLVSGVYLVTCESR